MDERRPVYEAVATLTVLTDGIRPREVAQRIQSALEAADE